MNHSPEETDPDPAPLKEADAERDTRERAEQVTDEPTEPADGEDGSSSDA
jgi:hypothetical protein